MHPKALINQAADLLRAVLQFDQPADAVVSAHFRKHHVLGGRERHALAETVYAVLRWRLLFQHLAQGGRGPLERRLALVGWQGERRTLDAATDDVERKWLAAVTAVDPSTLPAKLRHNLPDWLAGALHGQLDDTQFDLLAAALPKRGAAGLAGEHAEGQAGRRARNAATRRHQRRDHTTQCFGLADRRATRGQRDSGLSRRSVRGAGRGQPTAGVAGRCAARRDGGRLLRRRGRQDAGARRSDAQYRPPLCVRHLRPSPARVEAEVGPQRPVQRAHGADRTRARQRIKRLAGKVDRVLVDAPCSGLVHVTTQSGPQMAAESGHRGTTCDSNSKPSWLALPH